MKVLIAGSHGMVGSAVTRHLIGCGYQVIRLVRQAPGAGELWWDPDAGKIDTAGLEGLDGVVHLATMPWPMRWTEKAKQKIRENRLMTNRLLAKALAGCTQKPEVLICASGMGYYPSSGDTILIEDSPAGTSFVARLQRDGEAVTSPAEEAGIRVVHLRIPAVLGGPALQRVGFQAGDGQQWMSWIGREELASIIEFVLSHEDLMGPVNAVSPSPLRNADFARISTQALGQKPGGAMPAFIVRMVMGEMGEEFLLASRRIHPSRLLAAGYVFRFADLEETLRHEKEILNQSEKFAVA
ncbi:MAG: TIGR01777 family oxidoreductase [Bacteroidota bacterium]